MLPLASRRHMQTRDQPHGLEPLKAMGRLTMDADYDRGSDGIGLHHRARASALGHTSRRWSVGRHMLQKHRRRLNCKHYDV